ncbi:MAG: bifunctional (p)ppGpp synthetase/guanosine-3',5'-bis(diphosphate) 3'-pyrophosphohydrolase [Pseudomonadota bacterium]
MEHAPVASSPTGAARPPKRPMMRQYELVERVAAYNPLTDEALLNRAYVYSMGKHGDQRRASGDPYFSHPLEVAAILTGMKLDDATIAVALLHDVIEDTDATRAEIDQRFGPEIGKLVEGLTKIGRLHLVSQEDKAGENLRKLLLAIADDVRVLLVKLADRLHNMRTLQWVPPEKRVRIAEETMDVYAPLAGRMGIQWMREELEHLAFKVLKPQDAASIEKKLAERRAAVGSLYDDIETELKRKLEENGVTAQVSGREKRAYSIYAKMQRKSVNFETLSDVYGFRILVDDDLSCYKALGVIHTRFQSVPNRFKDYISIPKQNEYRSLHTTVIGPKRHRVELQIRTHEMHKLAEYGIAAHALHKDGASRTMRDAINESKAYAWLRQTVEQFSEERSSREFLHNTKLELFQDRVFCFTPRGKLIALPPGATPIDFAYQVHTQIGNTCTGARINGHPKPLVTPLHSGDEVEILCVEGASPPAAWHALAVTGKARAAIRRANRDSSRKKFARLGRELVANETVRFQLPTPPDLETAAERMSFPSVETMLHAVGAGERPASSVLVALGHDLPADRAEAPTGVGVRVAGAGGALPVVFSDAHPAIPGDGIVGILDPGVGVTVYPVHAGEALSAYSDAPDRWVEVSWDSAAAKGQFAVPVRVMANNTPGALAAIATATADAGANIDELSMVSKADRFREMRLLIDVGDTGHLASVLAALNALDAVSSAARETAVRDV